VNNARQAVKRVTDLPYQVKTRPWKMLGLALAVGSVIGRLSSRSRPGVNARDSGSRRLTARGAENIIARATENGRMIGSADACAQQVSVLKGATLGVIATIISEVARNAIPPLLARVERYAKDSTETQASNGETNAGTPFPNQ